jgi:hypothetical protein
MWAVPRLPSRLFHVRLFLFLFVLLAALFGPTEAGARGWEEVHQSADDVRLTVGPDGVAMIEHHLRFRIVAGRFTSFELAGIDPRAELAPESVVLPEQGDEIPARAEANPKVPGTVKIAFDVPGVGKGKGGLRRGIYIATVKYKLDLVAAKAIVRDGAMWKLAWTAPPAPEGRDGARVTYELPPAPTEPRLAKPEEAVTTLATLRRQPDKDELELVRTHVPRGEAVVWSARVDPKAFPAIAAPELRPPAPVALAASGAPPPPNRVPIAILATALASIAGLFAFVARAKRGHVARACERAGIRPRMLVPIPWGLGPFVYAAAATTGLATLVWGTPLHGAALVVVAMALAAHRKPTVIARPRGPGRWQIVADEEVLLPRPSAPAPGDALDAGTRRGKIVLLLVGAAIACAAYALRTKLPGSVIAIPLAGAALAPIFVTGTRAQMPRSPSDLAASFLRPVRDVLARTIDLAHVDVCCSARFRDGAARAQGERYDEVRLACGPRDRIPGLRAIELAFAGVLPEILVRYGDATEAASKIAAIAPKVPVVPGRVPEEKVLRLAPTAPTADGAAKLLAKLVAELEGRRATDRDERCTAAYYRGKERRGARIATWRAASAT